MNKSESFSFERFMSLGGSTLWRYAEPFVNTRQKAIPESAYDLLVSNLPMLDEEHVVYALEICMAIKPNEFARIVVGFLANAHSSVCCTAFRCLNGISPELVPADLRTRIAAIPLIDLFASDVQTENRICIGTNKEFVRDLVAKFPSALGG